MLVEIKKNKYFWIALTLLVLVPFMVYWIIEGYDFAMRHLTVTVMALLTILTQQRMILRQRLSSNRDANRLAYSHSASFWKLTNSTTNKVGAELLSDYDLLRKNEESTIDKIRKYLL